MKMVPQVVEVASAGPFALFVRFGDGSSGVWRPNVKSWKGSLGRPLQDAEFFAKAFVDMTAIAWPNGYDASPEAVMAEIEAAGELKAPNYAAE